MKGKKIPNAWHKNKECIPILRQMELSGRPVQKVSATEIRAAYIISSISHLHCRKAIYFICALRAFRQVTPGRKTGVHSSARRRQRTLAPPPAAPWVPAAGAFTLGMGKARTRESGIWQR